MFKAIGFCHKCMSLSEYSARPFPSPLIRPTCYRQLGQKPPPGSKAIASTKACDGPITDLWDNHHVAKAVLAAYAMGGWDAAFAVWEDAGRPELAYQW